MADLLYYIREEEVQGVMEKGDIGSGQKSFQGMAKEGNRIYVASKSGGELAVVGEIPIAKAYLEDGHPRGWKFRARSVRGGSVLYPVPWLLKDVKEALSILRNSTNIWNSIRNCRWLTEEDAGVLSAAGQRSMR